MASNAVPGFLPSRHGLHFPNRFPPGPTIRLGPLDPRWLGIGDAAAGLCGGFSWLVRERFELGLSTPADRDPPTNGSALFASLVRRQVRSLDWLRLPLRFWRRSWLRPEQLAERTLDRDLPSIMATIDAGTLVMVGLVRKLTRNPLRLTGNHQVLAYAYDVTASPAAIRIYDPNWPDRDDVELQIVREATPGGALDGLARITLRQSTGEPLYAFFDALP